MRLEIAVDLAGVQSLRGVLGGRRRDLAGPLGGRDPLVGVLRLLFGVRSQLLRLAMRLFGGGAGGLRGLVGQLPGLGKALPRLRYELACALLRDLGVVLRGLCLLLGLGLPLLELLVGVRLGGGALLLDLLVGGPARFGDRLLDATLQLALELCDLRAVALRYQARVLRALPEPPRLPPALPLRPAARARRPRGRGSSGSRPNRPSERHPRWTP